MLPPKSGLQPNHDWGLAAHRAESLQADLLRSTEKLCVCSETWSIMSGLARMVTEPFEVVLITVCSPQSIAGRNIYGSI
jgi:hypothetical protein